MTANEPDAIPAVPTDTADDLNYLMSKPVTGMFPADIDRIILYHRNQRAARESGTKTSRAASAPAPSGVKALLARKSSPISRRGM